MAIGRLPVCNIGNGAGLDADEVLFSLLGRFIPNRDGVDLQASYSLLHAEGSPSSPTKPKKKVANGELQYQKGMGIPLPRIFPLA